MLDIHMEMNFIIRSNDFLKVYYIKPSSGKDASFILRIDNIMK